MDASWTRSPLVGSDARLVVIRWPRSGPLETMMTMRREPMAWAGMLLGALWIGTGCGGHGDGASAAGDDAGPADDAATGGADAGPGGSGGGPDASPSALESLSVSPLALIPAFSPDVHDYVVRCAAGQNMLSVSMVAPVGATASVIAPTRSASAESQTVSVTVAEDQAIVVAAGGSGSDPYWIRCVPHDFPQITLALHPENGTPTPGYYVLGNTIVGAGEAGFAMVLDGNGTPVWYLRVPPEAVNVDLQPDGRISFIQGSGPFGMDPNAAFQLVQLQPWAVSYVQAVGGDTDFHELQPLPNGDHYVLSAPLVADVDLTGLQSFGPDEIINDCVIQEIAPTGTVVWQWKGTDHIDPVQESTNPTVTAFDGLSVIDVFHCNSIEPYDSDHVLVSARDMDAVWLVDKASGEIVWKLGGAPYSKDDAQLVTVVGDPEAAFYGQHDARLQANGDISVFDDHSNHPGVARGVEYALDLDSGTATMVWQYTGPANSAAMGSFRRYADGSNVIAWGLSTTLAMTEVDGNGDDLLDVSFDRGNSTYRAVKVATTALDLGVLRATAGHP
jgi:hypothetical protein